MIGKVMEGRETNVVLILCFLSFILNLIDLSFKSFLFDLYDLIANIVYSVYNVYSAPATLYVTENILKKPIDISQKSMAKQFYPTQ